MAIEHDSFTLTRNIGAPLSTVFHAWSDPVLKRKWFVENDGAGWELVEYGLDFRPLGREIGVWRANAPGQPWHGEHRNETTYFDIQPDVRIVYGYFMALNGVVHSSSLVTVEFADWDGGTRMVFTEQIAMIDSGYGVQGRVDGWKKLLDTFEGLILEGAE